MTNLESQKDILKYSKKLKKGYRRFNKKRLRHFSELKLLKDKVFEKQVLDKYSNTSVDSALKPYAKNIKYSSLQTHGITNLYQLKNFTQRELVRYEGIGPKSASKIVYARDRAFKDIKNNHQLTFQSKNLSKLELKFLAKVALVVENKVNFKYLDEFKRKELKTISKLERSIRFRKNFLLRVFFGRENKGKINNLNDELKINLNNQQTSQFEYLLDIFSRKYDLSPIQISEVFAKRASDFYAEIESLSGYQRETYTGIPKDLLKQIENIKLDTTYLNVSLRQYQYFGAQFAIKQKKIIIGDEMGLGKTIQSIAVFAHLKAMGKTNFLVEVPASVLYNWKIEIEKHSDLNPVILGGYNLKNQIIDWEKNGGVGILTYQTLVASINIFDKPIDAFIIDEAHFIKNPKAQRTRASKLAIDQSEYTIFLTGTPIENRVEEFVQLISFVDGPLANKLLKSEILNTPIKFKNEIVSRYLRRNRIDVLKELPEIDQIEQWVEFDSSQELDYINALRQENFMLMRRIAWIAGDPTKSPKLIRLKDLHQEAIANDRKMIVFSFFKDVIEIISNEFSSYLYGPITGSMSSQKRQELIESFQDAPSGSMIVSQIDAGGVGLNIQSANTVVICEPQLKPSTEVQAISRVYRMGQTRDVIVYRLLTEVGVDKYLLDRLNTKQFVFENYAKESVLDLQYKNSEKEAKNLEKDLFKQESLRLQVNKPSVK